MMNYKKIVDKLESVIPLHNNHKWWVIELSEHYIEGETVVLINLLNTGDGNKYRLYHSELDDRVKTDRELLACCLENLHEVYEEIKSVMSSVLESGYVMLGEMEDEQNTKTISMKYPKSRDIDFKIGDTVRIRSWEDMENEYGLELNGDIKMFPEFWSEMRYLCGKEFVIMTINNNKKRIQIIDDWEIGFDMIEKVEE